MSSASPCGLHLSSFLKAPPFVCLHPQWCGVALWFSWQQSTLQRHESRENVPLCCMSKLCWLLDSSDSYFWFLGGNFVRRFSFSLQGGLGLFYQYALGSFGWSFLGKHTDNKQLNTIRFLILNIDKYYSPLFV
jgi:hypothetical protein